MPMLVLNGAHRVEAVLELEYGGSTQYGVEKEQIVLHVLGANDVEEAVEVVRSELTTWDSQYGPAQVSKIRFDSVGHVNEVPAHGTVVLA